MDALNTSFEKSPRESSLGDAEEQILECLQNLEKEEQAISQFIDIQTFQKGEHLIREGETVNKNYSVLKGVVRQYYLVDGEEKTTFFYSEGHSIFSLHGDAKTRPAKHYLSCVEESLSLNGKVFFGGGKSTFPS